MELTAEETVTRLLSSHEVLGSDMRNVFISEPICDLGEYLKNYKPEPSPYEGKYVFIR